MPLTFARLSETDVKVWNACEDVAKAVEVLSGGGGEVTNDFMKITWIVFFVTLSAGAFAQQKFEKEYRLKTAEVPLLARQFVDSLNFDRRVKWYMELSQNGTSVEAKGRRDGKRYSVEFDTTGKIQDVEIEVPFGAIPDEVQSRMTQQLQGEFDRYKILKMQEQFTGTRNELLTYLTKPQGTPAPTTRYEAIVKGSKNGEMIEFEFTFSSRGEIEKKATVVFRNTDNLEY